MRVLVSAGAAAALAGAVTAQLDPAAAATATGSVRVAGATYAYRLLEPPVEARGTPAPLVVFLHGAGERGADNWAQLAWLPEVLARPAHRARFPCYLLALQCPPGERWVDVPWDDAASRPLAPEPTRALQAVLAVVDSLSTRPGVDAARVYLTGLSMGGFGAWDLAARCPERFAGVLAICGGGDERQAAAMLGLPIRVVHGADDPVVPVARSRAMVAALRDLGAPVVYDELRGVGHDAWRHAYGDGGALEWLFAQDQRQQGRGRYATRPLVPMPTRMRTDRDADPHKLEPTSRLVAEAAAAEAAHALAAELDRGGYPIPVAGAVSPRDGDIVLRLEPTAGDWCRVEVGARIEVVARDAAGLHAGAAAVWQSLCAWPRTGAPRGAFAFADAGVRRRIELCPPRPWNASQLVRLVREAWAYGYREIGGVDLTTLSIEEAEVVRQEARRHGIVLAVDAAPAGSCTFPDVLDVPRWLAATGAERAAGFVVRAAQDPAAAFPQLAVMMATAAERAAHPREIRQPGPFLARLCALLRG